MSVAFKVRPSSILFKRLATAGSKEARNVLANADLSPDGNGGQPFPGVRELANVKLTESGRVTIMPLFNVVLA